MAHFDQVFKHDNWLPQQVGQPIGMELIENSDQVIKHYNWLPQQVGQPIGLEWNGTF